MTKAHTRRSSGLSWERLARPRLQASQSTDPVSWCPHEPTERQRAFLERDEREALYGGAAGGGKTDALLMAALRHVDIPSYRAIIFRRTYPQLEGADGLIERSMQWLAGRAKWSAGSHRWTFPSGATLKFGHLQHEHSKYDHQGPSYHFIGFDELTQFTETLYRYLVGRLRRLTEDADSLTLRVRSASNPGGVGHEWVKRRFVDTRTAEAPFVPARLEDNPYLDQEEYVQALMQLHPLEREQLLRGDWDAIPSGGFFQREWFKFADRAPEGCRWMRYWDLAATAPKPGQDPDWTAGGKVSLHGGVWYIADIVRFREGPDGVERRIQQTARMDGAGVAIRMEQEPGSSGKALVSHYARNVLQGFPFLGQPSSGPKEVRAAPLASAAEQGNVVLLRAPWNAAFIDEATMFPHGPHDDQVDCISGAVALLRPGAENPVTSGNRRRTAGLRSIY